MSMASLIDLVVVTGLSGAGRGTAAKSLEDLGWFVIDNLPPALIPSVAGLASRSQGGVQRVAVVVDVRTGPDFAGELGAVFRDIDSLGLHHRLLFLEATDEVLVRRFDGVRRPHPLQGDGTIASGIRAERELLRELRGEADLVIDTSVLNVHELRAKIASAIGGEINRRLSVTLLTFGYKYGLPVDADVVLDCRFLPNPHWVPHLRPLSGLDDDVREWVMSQEGATEFVDEATALLRRIEVGYVHEGKHFATIAIGCTGGKHRSVTIAEQLRVSLADDSVEINVTHRDLGRE